MSVESRLVRWVFTDECSHPNRFRVELLLIKNFEIGRLDFPDRDTLDATHCFLTNDSNQRDRTADRRAATNSQSRGFAEFVLFGLGSLLRFIFIGQLLSYAASLSEPGIIGILIGGEADAGRAHVGDWPFCCAQVPWVSLGVAIGEGKDTRARMIGSG